MTAPDDRVAEIRQRLEAATGVHRVIVDALDLAPGQPAVLFDVVCDAVEGSDLADRCHMIGTPAADDEADLAWLLSRLAVVEAERDEPRAKLDRTWREATPAFQRLYAALEETGREVEAPAGDESWRYGWAEGYTVACTTLRRVLSGTTEGPS